MMNEEPKNTSPTRQTLVAIYHPAFRDGYQMGRQQYFRKQAIFTDKELVECLQSILEESKTDGAEEQDGSVYHAIGCLLGQVSGHVIPRQPHEENAQEVQQAFLGKVLQTHGATGQTLVDTIRQLWIIQDQLAVTLGADIFEQMLNRGAQPSAL